MVKEDEILEALKDCYDPEIPVNIVDLGLVYDVNIIDDAVKITMTLTFTTCSSMSARAWCSAGSCC